MFDFKVTKKTPTLYGDVLDTGSIDFIAKKNNEFIDFEIITEEEDIALQGAGLLTLYQKGNDLVYVNNGNKWAEIPLGSAFVLQVLEDLQMVLQELFPQVIMSYETKNINGQDVLSVNYEVA